MYQRIEALAKAQGKTIAQVSRESGVPESTLSMIKKRGGKLSLDNAIKVSKSLGVTVEDLLEKGEPRSRS